MAEGAAPLDIVRIVTDHHQALYRYAYRLSGSVADAEDLTQQVFLVAQQKLDQVRDAQCARGWLFTVLRNCYLKSFRGRLPLAAGDFDIDNVPQESVDQDFDGEHLQRAIDALGDEFKIVVLMFYFEHLSYRQIAAQLDMPIGTVMSRLARAKTHLRRLLNGGAHDAMRADESEVNGESATGWRGSPSAAAAKRSADDGRSAANPATVIGSNRLDPLN